MKNGLAIILLLFCFNYAGAQYAYLTNLSGTVAYGGINVTVTSGGFTDSAPPLYSCKFPPMAYWAGKFATDGWFEYDFSPPVRSFNVRAVSINGGPYGTGEYLQVSINGSAYTLSPTDMNSYNPCIMDTDGPTYLYNGVLMGPLTTASFSTVNNGGDFTISQCSGISSLKLYNGNTLGGSVYHIKIDTTIFDFAHNHINGPDSVCVGATISLTDSIVSGVWTSSNPSIASVSSGSVFGWKPGFDTISYTTGSCIFSKIIKVLPVPFHGEIEINGGFSFCIGQTYWLTESDSEGYWSLSNNRAVLKGDSITGLSAGWDTLFYTDSNICGKIVDTASFLVTYMLPINGPLSACVGDTVALWDTGGSAMWSSDGGIVYIEGNMQDSGITVGLRTGVAIITFQMDLGCVAYATFTVNPLPDAGKISGPDGICKGAIPIFSETVGGGFWSSANSFVATIDSISGLVTVVSPGTCTLVYTVPANAFNCSNSADFPFTYYSSPPFSISGLIAPASCYGSNNGSITLNVITDSGQMQYLWSRGDTTATINSLSPGSYSVRVSDTTIQCNLADTFTISQPDSITMAPVVTDDLCQKGTGKIHITVGGGTSPYRYYWSNDSTGNSVSGLLAGSYGVHIIDSNNCEKTAFISVPEGNCPDIIVHNVITPNGDGINDVWVIENIESYPKNVIQVFDKWGDKVYEQDNYNNDWGGRSTNGDLLPNGTYFYVVKLNAAAAAVVQDVYKGSLLIKR